MPESRSQFPSSQSQRAYNNETETSFYTRGREQSIQQQEHIQTRDSDRDRNQEGRRLRRPHRLDNLRAGIADLFSSTSGSPDPSSRSSSRMTQLGVDMQERGRDGYTGNEDISEEPKTPVYALGLRDISPTRLDIPHLRRSATPSLRSPTLSLASPTALQRVFSRGNGERERDSITPREYSGVSQSRSRTQSLGRASSNAASRPGTRHEGVGIGRDGDPADGSDALPAVPEDGMPVLERLRSLPPAYIARTRSQRLVGVDPEEQHLAELAEQGRRRQRRRRRRQRGSDRDLEAQEGEKGRRCFPQIKNRVVRSKLSTCMVSAILLLFILAIYLATAFTNEIQNQEFHILLILLILVSTIFFCHSIIQLCIVIVRPPSGDVQDMADMIGPGGYADPPRPIRVALAYDEEVAGVENDAHKLPPPAYGLWRESVRMDPNRLFWQRNPEAPATIAEEERPTTANRPPSYMSDDGITYVVEAVPRSTAPIEEDVLPVHPSERGRIGRSSP